MNEQRQNVLTVAWESSWSSFWLEGEALGHEEHMEATRLFSWSEPYAPNVEVLEKLHSTGWLWIVGARVSGVLQGYCLWTVEPNVLSMGRNIVRQGAMFVRPGFARLGIASKMLAFAMGEFEAHLAPVRLIAHHPAEGRGVCLASLFRRRGLYPIQSDWAIELLPHERSPS